MEKRRRVFFCDISEFGICAQSRGADPDATVFQRPGFPAFSSAVADCAEQKADGQVTACYLIFTASDVCDRVFPGRYYPGKCGDFVNFPVYQYFYRDCGDCASLVLVAKKGVRKSKFNRIRKFSCGLRKAICNGVVIWQLYVSGECVGQ